MKHVSIRRAVGAEKAQLVIGEQIGAFQKLDEQAEFCAREAQSVEEMLFNTLPGATYDRLLAQMQSRKSGFLLVSHSSRISDLDVNALRAEIGRVETLEDQLAEARKTIRAMERRAAKA